MRSTALLALFAGVLLLENAFCVSVGKKESDNSVEAQLAAFEIHEDFEISLFADESMGIANPVAMHWDGKGRLWVLTTLTYAQMEPGENPNDTLVILEDTDGDGRADTTTVFAEGLEMPMGFALREREDGIDVYLGEGPDLLLLRDTDGDLRADSREVVLTGFGTGDTHQNISNFTWGPDGCLYFSQGLHCFSRVETPWGIVRGDTAGFFRFHPDTLRLEPFCFPSLASQNPCGIVFTKEGELFIKSNNKELIFASPGLVPAIRRKNLAAIGNVGSTPGKSMGGEYVDAPHLPDWIQDHVLIAGYYSHRVSAFPLVREGAGFAKVVPVEILSSKHSSFRPVEVRVGPDGAIYVADWFNPIIGHYQASLRHPDRDETHGRVWRITAKGRPLQDRSEIRDSFSSEAKRIRTSVDLKAADFANSENASDRLWDVINGAQARSPEALPVILRVLDHPRDRFLDYALEQAVQVLAPQAIPLVSEGEIEFESPDHLAFFLQQVGGSEALEIARMKFQDASLSGEARERLALVLARVGAPQDLDLLLRAEPVGRWLELLVEGTEGRKIRPTDPEASSILAGSLQSGNSVSKVSAAVLSARWGLKGNGEALRQLLLESGEEIPVRSTAARMLAALEGKEAEELLLTSWHGAPASLRPALAEALVTLAPRKVASLVATDLGKWGKEGRPDGLLLPFLSRKGAKEILLEALQSTEVSQEAAEAMVASLSRMGQNDEALLGFLQDTMGVVSGNRAYSAEFVAKLVAEVKASGDPKTGEEVYHRAVLTCVACHQLDGAGGVIGPSLDTVGAGLTPDLLVESVLWPQRQLKEGYFAITVATKGGETYSGYRDREEDGTFYLRDTATGQEKALPRTEVSRIENVGSLMPGGLTNGLSREELRDLIAFLSSLKG